LKRIGEGLDFGLRRNGARKRIGEGLDLLGLRRNKTEHAFKVCRFLKSTKIYFARIDHSPTYYQQPSTGTSFSVRDFEMKLVNATDFVLTLA
jgi:hypothetical protein